MTEARRIERQVIGDDVILRAKDVKLKTADQSSGNPWAFAFTVRARCFSRLTRYWSSGAILLRF